MIDHVSDHENNQIVKAYGAEMAKVDSTKVLTKDSFRKGTKIQITNYIKGLHQMDDCDAFLPLLEPWKFKKKSDKINQNEQKSRGKEKISITFAIIIHPNLSNISHIFLYI